MKTRHAQLQSVFKKDGKAQWVVGWTASVWFPGSRCWKERTLPGGPPTSTHVLYTCVPTLIYKYVYNTHTILINAINKKKKNN